jgi:hypothetical protein
VVQELRLGTRQARKSAEAERANRVAELERIREQRERITGLSEKLASHLDKK